MIMIKNKQDCCGCFSCKERCPSKCIDMQADEEGFFYPSVNANKCIECGLCTKVCPVLNQSPPQKPVKTHVIINPDPEIKEQSSSGGAFSLLAEKIINDNGIVFGARFDNQWSVIHDYTSNIKDLYKFRSSKYVQSSINNTFSQTETILKNGKKVLFSGTPCQIAGLKKYLRKDYPQLYTVDFICHGVPSPLVWKSYLNETLAAYKITSDDIISINFRDKSLGWKKFSFTLQFNKNGQKKKITEVFYRNYYIRGFLHDIYIRPSCYSCPSKAGKSNSDITIADFWGIQHIYPELNDDRGASLMFVNSSKGEALCKELNSHFEEVEYQTILQYNKSIEQSTILPVNKRERFFKGFGCKKVSSLVIELTDFSLSERIKEKIKKIISW